MASKGFCGHCGEQASDGCKGCMNMTYCSPECQQADWQFHKHLCKQWEEFKEKPGPDVRRAIVLPEHSSKPFFKWLPVPEGSDARAARYLEKEVDANERHRQGIDTSEETSVPNRDGVESDIVPDIDEIYGPDAPHRDFVEVVPGTSGSGELLDHNIHVWMISPVPTVRPNPFLAKHGGKDAAPRFRGEIIIVAMTKDSTNSEPGWTLDADTRHLTLALDGVAEMSKRMELMLAYFTTPKDAKKLKGVKINVTEPFIESVDILVHHPVFRSDNSLFPLLQKTNCHLRVTKYRAPATPPTPPTSNTVESQTHFNYIRLNVDPDSPNFGVAPAKLHDPDWASMLFAMKGHESVHCFAENIAWVVERIENSLSPRLQRIPLAERREKWERLEGVNRNLWK